MILKGSSALFVWFACVPVWSYQVGIVWPVLSKRTARRDFNTSDCHCPRKNCAASWLPPSHPHKAHDKKVVHCAEAEPSQEPSQPTLARWTEASNLTLAHPHNLIEAKQPKTTKTVSKAFAKSVIKDPFSTRSRNSNSNVKTNTKHKSWAASAGGVAASEDQKWLMHSLLHAATVPRTFPYDWPSCSGPNRCDTQIQKLRGWVCDSWLGYWFRVHNFPHEIHLWPQGCS